MDPAALRAPERCHRPVYELTPDFAFGRERLQFLVWANNYDARGGDPIWWHGRKAARRFAGDGVGEGGAADIMLADGAPMYIDGGPTQPPALPSRIEVVHRWNAEGGRLQPAGHSQPASELAPDQLAAVCHRTGGARVIAPAGSGKTRVLTERLRHLVGDRGVHPGTITALAYNTKAARELKERCGDIEGSEKLNIRTLNSFGLWICNEFGSAGRRRVLEEPAVRELLQRHIEIRRQANTDTVAPYLAALSSIRLGLNAPEVVEEADPDASGIAEGFEPYRAALAEAGAVDFDEQIYQAIEILLTNPDARSVAQSTCRHLLVDEFQDLNPAHLLLIRLLAAPAYDCFGVGDDDQVIYGYSGATPEFLINFSHYFPGAGAHDLNVNYRCPPAVIDVARHLLSYNAGRIEKIIGAPAGRTDELANFGGPLSGCGPVAVVKAAADALAGLAVEAISAWRAAGSTPATSPSSPGSTRPSCRCRWPAWKRAFPAPPHCPPACCNARVSAPRSPTSGSGPTRTTSGAKTSSRRSAAPPGASHPTWSTCSPVGRRPQSPTCADSPAASQVATSRNSRPTRPTSRPSPRPVVAHLPQRSKPSESTSGSTRPWTSSMARARRRTAPPMPTT